MSTAKFLDAPYDIAAGDRPPLALIAGPTASGKRDCAVLLAQELERRGRRGVIVNADSSQVYADLRVLSDRPSPEEMGGRSEEHTSELQSLMRISSAVIGLKKKKKQKNN